MLSAPADEDNRDLRRCTLFPYEVSNSLHLWFEVRMPHDFFQDFMVRTHMACVPALPAVMVRIRQVAGFDKPNLPIMQRWVQLLHYLE